MDTVTARFQKKAVQERVQTGARTSREPVAERILCKLPRKRDQPLLQGSSQCRGGCGSASFGLQASAAPLTPPGLGRRALLKAASVMLDLS